MPGPKEFLYTGIPSIVLSGIVSFWVSKFVCKQNFAESDKRHICNKFDDMQTKCAIYWGTDGQQSSLATEINVGLRNLGKDIAHCHAADAKKRECKMELHTFFRTATAGSFESKKHVKNSNIRQRIIWDGQRLREKLTAMFD